MEEGRRKHNEWHFAAATDSSDFTQQEVGDFVGDFGGVFQRLTGSIHLMCKKKDFVREASFGSSLTTLGTAWHRPCLGWTQTTVSGGAHRPCLGWTGV